MSPAWVRAILLLVVAATVTRVPATAQVPAEPMLHGRAFLGDSILRAGTVVLHRVSATEQGEVDSTALGRDGSFSFRLARVPDPQRSEVYFASVRHAGILYFGKALTLPVQLDSLYEIQTYDTALAPRGGADLTIQARSVFLEADSVGAWRVTDLFEIRQDGSRTLVATEGDIVWHHPLAEGAAGAEVSRTDAASGGAEIRDAELTVIGPIPPGDQLLVVRYTVPEPFLSLPVRSRTEALEVLVREPAPPMEAPGLQQAPPVEFQPGITFRRFVASGVESAVLRFVEGRSVREPPVRWIAVVLALILTAVALRSIQPRPGHHAAGTARPPVRDRRALILEVARLDEDWARHLDPTPEERGAYEARRRELLRRIASLG